MPVLFFEVSVACKRPHTHTHTADREWVSTKFFNAQFLGTFTSAFQMFSINADKIEWYADESKNR